jgi:hypothetical protein
VGNKEDLDEWMKVVNRYESESGAKTNLKKYLIIFI